MYAADVSISEYLDHRIETPRRSLVILFPKAILLFAVLTLIVNAALAQLELFLTNGSMPFAPQQLTIILVCLCLMVVLKKRLQATSLLSATIALCLYCPLEMMFLNLHRGLSTSESRGCIAYLLFFAVVGATSAVPLEINPRPVLTVLMLLTFACLLVSLAQYVTNSPVVATESADNLFRVQSYQFFGRTRGFSLFTNGLEAGVFYSFMGGVAVSFICGNQSKLLSAGLLLACAFGCYATYTRLTIVGFLVTAIAVMILSHNRSARLSRLLPLFSLGASVFIVALGLHASGGAAQNGLTNITSFDERLYSWGFYGTKLMSGTPLDLLLGIGQGEFVPYSMPDRPQNAAPIQVDNAYLLTLLGTGICGLTVLCFTYWNFWIFIHRRAVSSRSHLLRGIAGVFATLPFFSAINDSPVQILVLMLLAVSLKGNGEPSGLPEGPAVTAHLAQGA